MTIDESSNVPEIPHQAFNWNLNLKVVESGAHMYDTTRMKLDSFNNMKHQLSVVL